MLSRARLLLPVLLALNSAFLFAGEPAEIAALRAKAEKGNAIAQYNLGLAYAEGQTMPADLPEAFVWLTLASENGATGKALTTVQAALSPAQIAEGHKRVEAYRTAIIASQFKSAPSKSAPKPDPDASTVSMASGSFRTSPRAVSAADTEVESLRNDRHQLSEELAAAWKENNELKAGVATLTQTLATAAAAAQRDADAKTDAAKTKLSAELETTRQKLAVSESVRADLANRLAPLRAQLKTAQDAASAAARVSADSGAASAALPQARARIDELIAMNARLEAAAAASAKNAAELAATRQELGSARERLSAYATAAANQAAALDSAHQEAAAAQSALSTLRAQASPGSASATDATTAAKVSALQSDVTSLRANNQKLGEDLAAASQSAGKSRLALAAATAELASARARVAQLEQGEKTAAVAATQVSTLQASIADLRAQLEASTAARAKPDPTADRQLAELQSRLQSLENERVAQRTQLTEAATAKDEAEAKLALALRSYTVLQSENESLKAASERTSAERPAPVHQAADTAEADALRAQLRQLQSQVAALTEENSGLKSRPTPVTPDLDAIRAHARDAEREIAAAHEANRALAEQNARLKATLAAGPTTAARPVGAVAAGPTAPTRPGSVQAAAITAPPLPPPPPAPRTHVIAPGDTLGKIARQYYGTANRWPEILAANRDVLHDERNLAVGRTLRIP